MAHTVLVSLTPLWLWCFPLTSTLCLAVAIDLRATLPTPADPLPLSSPTPPHSPLFPILLMHKFSVPFTHFRIFYSLYLVLCFALDSPSLCFLSSSSPSPWCILPPPSLSSFSPSAPISRGSALCSTSPLPLHYWHLYCPVPSLRSPSPNCLRPCSCIAQG